MPNNNNNDYALQYAVKFLIMVLGVGCNNIIKFEHVEMHMNGWKLRAFKIWLQVLNLPSFYPVNTKACISFISEDHMDALKR